MPILALADWLASPVEPAEFPKAVLRWRGDRAAREVGLDHLTDERWLAHFARFEPLPDNLPHPLALKYHGHQFRVYNPDIGDGRGFLFAQMRGRDGWLRDLGTKGSGTTPYSRGGDGRLTLKGAVRELLATEMLEALGVDTSRTFSIVETGEELVRGDEPSPTRSAVLVRSSHGHIRIGSFQRLAALEERDHLAALVDYALVQFPGPPLPHDVPGRDEPAAILMHQVVARMADLAASYMAAGFVHGVLNTDNMNVSGESFDYGPWRWLPRWDAGFTAAYFDHSGLYAFGRQPEAMHWNCAQLAIALRPLVDAPPLIAALDRFAPLYRQAMARRFLWRLGVAGSDPQSDIALVEEAEAALASSGDSPAAWFASHRYGAGLEGEAGEALRGRDPLDGGSGDGDEALAEDMLIDEVEAIWSAIDREDDWQPLYDKVALLRQLGSRLGEAPETAYRLTP